MDLQGAADNFAGVMRHCDNLVAVHRAAGSGGRGWREKEPSVNRGTVVLAVASWQAFIQDVARALRDAIMDELAGLPQAQLIPDAMSQWNRDFDTAVKNFSTPGPEQSKALLKRVGFDPYPCWTWTQGGGRGNGRFTVEPKHVAEVINQWLDVRHQIAHGDATLTPRPILQAVRDGASSAKAKAAPTLRLDDAVDCVRFFRSVARLTADSAATHLGTSSPQWQKPPTLTLGLHVSHLAGDGQRHTRTTAGST